MMLDAITDIDRTLMQAVIPGLILGVIHRMV
jgi:hypothetical protein